MTGHLAVSNAAGSRGPQRLDGNALDWTLWRLGGARLVEYPVHLARHCSVIVRPNGGSTAGAATRTTKAAPRQPLPRIAADQRGMLDRPPRRGMRRRRAVDTLYDVQGRVPSTHEIRPFCSHMRPHWMKYGQCAMRPQPTVTPGRSGEWVGVVAGRCVQPCRTVRHMQKISLDSQAQEQLEQAVSTSSGRSATTVHGGRGNSPRAARTGAACWRRDHLGGAQRRPDRHPPARHALRAIGDAAVLITVAKPG